MEALHRPVKASVKQWREATDGGPGPTVSATLSLDSACLWLFKARSDVCLSIKAAAEHKAHPETMNYRDGKKYHKKLVN